LVASFEQRAILAAYSHGHAPRTLSAQEVWGWGLPYLQSVNDPHGDPNTPCGSGGNHCVGLSATGAAGLANEGWGFGTILGHYYQGTTTGLIPTYTVRVAIYAL